LNIQLTCRHCDVSDDVRDYAEKKTERLLRHFNGVHNVEMILSEEGGKPTVELVVSVVRGQHCVAKESAEDFTAAVDVVVDKLVRQLQKVKGKLRERHGRSAAPPPPTGSET